MYSPPCPVFHVGAGDIDPDPLAYEASPLPTTPCLQPFSSLPRLWLAFPQWDSLIFTQEYSLVTTNAQYANKSPSLAITESSETKAP